MSQMWAIKELLPSGRTVTRALYAWADRAKAEQDCYLFNIDLDEENHHFVEAVDGSKEIPQ